MSTFDQVEGMLQDLARHIDDELPAGCSFALIVFMRHGGGPVALHVGNADKADLPAAFRDLATRFEGGAAPPSDN